MEYRRFIETYKYEKNRSMAPNHEEDDDAPTYRKSSKTVASMFFSFLFVPLKVLGIWKN